MTQYNILNIKLSNSQLNKSKSEIKNDTDITLKLQSNVPGDSNDENNFPLNTQVSRLCKVFANNFSANIKLLKTKFHIIG